MQTIVRHVVRALLGLIVLSGIVTGRVSAATSPAWTQKAVSGDIAYFAFASPARIERYNMATEQWLTPIALTNTPTAFAVDAQGMVIAYNRSVVTRALDGTGETGLINQTQDVKGLLLSDTLIFIISPTSYNPTITSIRRSDRQFVATWSGTYAFGSGFAIATANRRIYGINTMTTGGDLDELDYNADGTFPTGYKNAGSYYYTSSAYPRTYVSPNEQTLILGAGYVFDATSLTYRTSIAGSFDDMAFYGSDVPIVLRSDKLYAYSNTFLESGTYQLPAAAQAVAVRAGKAFAFAADAGQTSGVAVTGVAVSSFSAAQPGAAVDPTAISFVPDNVMPAGDDTFFLFSKTYQSIFRWSAVTRRYVAVYPLLGSPSYAAYSPTLNRLYTAYSTGRINQIKLDAGGTTEVPFANLPTAAKGLQAAGALVFAMDGSGAWGTHYTYTSDGTLKNSREWNYYSTEYIWSAVQQRMYFFRDDTSPNDILYEAIDANGVLSNPVDSPYHGDYAIAHPIRLSTDETTVLTGPGVIYSATTLSVVGSLANNVTDAVSRSNRWVTIRTVGSDTQLQTWTQNLLFSSGLTVPRYPLRIQNLSDGRLLVLTTTGGPVSSNYGSTTGNNSGRLVMSVVDLAGSGTVETSPIITTDPASTTAYRGKAVSLTVAAQGSSLTYQWLKNGQPVSGATSSILNLATVQLADAGSYTATVSNGFGSVTSAAAILTVQEPPPAPTITAQPQSTTAGTGYSATFSVTASGTALSYQWRKDSTPISGATSSTYTISSITSANYASYDVVVTNPSGSVTSSAATLSAPPAPTISQQPVGAGRAAGASATFSVTATSTGLSYQWYKDGTALTGRTSSSLSLYSITAADYGSYYVVVTNMSGSIQSDSVQLSAPSRLTNLSVRTDLTAGQVIILGFVTNAGSKDVLTRAAGPYLTSLNLGLNGLPDPRMSVYNGPNLVLQNNDWSSALTSIFTQIGAGPFGSGSKDAAVLLNISGSSVSTRSVQVSGTGTDAGTVLVEAYDASPSPTTRLINVSARNHVGTGNGVLIAGFVIEGPSTLRVLIRGLGPDLLKYGVPDPLADPVLTVYQGSRPVASNDNWDPSLSTTFTQVGAGALTAGSTDSAILLTLSPGVYSAILSGKDNGTGEGLVEIFEVP